MCQFNGSYQNIPSFLDSAHTIETKADCEAYLARLNGFATVMDQEIEVARHDMALGVVPPDFTLVTTLRQLQHLRAPAPETSSLTESLVRRAREQKIAGDYARAAAQRVKDKVYPALDRQIALIREMQKVATHDAGVWKLPGGLSSTPPLSSAGRPPAGNRRSYTGRDWLWSRSIWHARMS